MHRNALTAAAAVVLAFTSTAHSQDKPYRVEWVYRIQYGHQSEWWTIFQKYQIAILDREKQHGYVTSYTVDRPGLHTSGDSSWDHRVIITYPDYAGSTHEREVRRQLFPDKTALEREERGWWEPTLNHWDLPIREIDPRSSDD